VFPSPASAASFPALDESVVIVRPVTDVKVERNIMSRLLNIFNSIDTRGFGKRWNKPFLLSFEELKYVFPSSA
jgi:hypothetical protein